MLNRARQLGPQVKDALRGRTNAERYFERYPTPKVQQAKNRLPRKPVPAEVEEPWPPVASKPTPPQHQYPPNRIPSPVERYYDLGQQRQPQRRSPPQPFVQPAAPNTEHTKDYDGNFPTAGPAYLKNEIRSPPRTHDRRASTSTDGEFSTSMEGVTYGSKPLQRGPTGREASPERRRMVNFA